MSYMLNHNMLFVKVTKSSPIWPTPHESWEQIELADLPADVAGIIEFKPLPADKPKDKDKEYKIKVIMPKSTVPEKPKDFNNTIGTVIGSGKTVTDVAYTLYDAEPSSERKDYCYVMEMETGKKYAASKSTIDQMISLFERLHSPKDCTTMEELKDRLLRATTNQDPYKNIHYFRIFFYLLVIRGAITLQPVEGQKKVKIIINKP